MSSRGENPMKASVLAVSLALAAAGPALAADLPTTKGPPPAPMMAYVPYSWTGFYIGGQLGGAWNESDWSRPAGSTFNTAAYGDPGSGFLYGGQAGYNYQINQFVLGVEGDIAGSTIKADTTCIATTGPIAGATCQTKQDWLASVRARGGYAFDRFLLYVDGGVAFTDYNFAETTLAPKTFGSGSRTGWTIGLGLDYAFTDHIIGGVEYNYYNFGARNGANLAGPSTGLIRFNESENTVAATLSYKF
jgi:outer membrane immunogenic protein